MRADGEASKQAQAIELALAKMKPRQATARHPATVDGGREPGGNPRRPRRPERQQRQADARKRREVVPGDLANLRRAKKRWSEFGGKERLEYIKGDAAATG